MTQAGGVLPAVAPPPSRGGAVARTAAIARLELAIQRRDPLTALYPLVLGLLAFAYASGGPVELVPSRGAVARTSPWAIALACTGLVAFGQVITTMVAATVVLRDRAVRMDALLATGALRTREYLAGKLCAACVVLVIVYAAIPLGLWLGIAAGEGLASACTVRALDAVLRPFVALVLPVMVGVGALQFAAGVLAGRLWLIVGQGLVLIWLWSAALGAAGRGTRGAALLVDPFASAPLVASTLAWPDAMRRSTPLPLDAAWGTNRVAWFAIAGMALALAFARGRIAAVADSRGGRGLGAPRDAVRRDPRNGASRAPRDEGGARGTAHVARATASTIAADAWRRTAPAAPRVSTTIVVLARHTARWMLRDAGWRVLAALGALNVAVQAWRAARGGGDATVLALDTLVVHARLFLILLATIYAGELLWREEEQRSAPLLDALPVRRWATTVGGLAGVIAAQLVLVALLASVAAMATVAAGARSPNAGAFAVGVAAWIAAPFVAWMLLSWAVHVVVRHKVAAHFACIAAWVVAITVHDAMRDVALWRAFTLPPIVPLDAVRDALPFHRAVRAAGAWLAAGIVALLLVLPRATRRR